MPNSLKDPNADPNEPLADLGFMVRADKTPEAMMDELNQAMDQVTVKNAPEFLRLLDQVMGVMNADLSNPAAAGAP